jgi:hypothetical protein
MQWYVYLVSASAVAVIGWLALDILGQPLRAFAELRRGVLEQMRVLENIALPAPRELAVSSRQIAEYDAAVKTLRTSQRALGELGSRLLAFGESEPVACGAVAAFGMNPVSAGSDLIAFSMLDPGPDVDRNGLRQALRKALRVGGAMRAFARAAGGDGLFAVKAGSIDLSNV